MKTTLASLAEYIEPLPVLSVHEHHREDDFFRDFDLDRLIGCSYVNWVCPFSGAAADREAFLDRVRFSSYFTWLERGLACIYGTGRLTADNWDRVSGVIRRAHQVRPGWSVDVLRAFGRYRGAIQDSYWDIGSDAGHPELFRPTYRINCFVMGHHPTALDHNGNSPWAEEGFPGGRFGDFLAFIEHRIAAEKAAGAVALKSALAYDRDLAFRPAEAKAAARAFGRRPADVDPVARRAFQDFVFDHICGLAAKYELPFQNHTGLGIVAGSNPLGLIPMIERHPQTRFVLFHSGYPWIGEVAALAHNYRNVHPDLTWLPIISTSAAVRALREFMETGATARTLCWGGDAISGEESVGAALAFKHALAVALAQLVDEGALKRADAERLAGRLCAENAAALYGLPLRLPSRPGAGGAH